MRSITLRPGESIVIGDTMISVEFSDLKPENLDAEFPVLHDLRPILIEILACGVSQAEVADRLDISPASVSQALNGPRKIWTPLYPNGVQLMRLHREVCGLDLETAHG